VENQYVVDIIVSSFEQLPEKSWLDGNDDYQAIQVVNLSEETARSLLPLAEELHEHGIFVTIDYDDGGPGLVRYLEPFLEPQSWCPDGFRWVRDRWIREGWIWRCEQQ